MSAQDLEQRARELLAAELEAEGDQSIAIKLRRGDAGMDYSFVAAIRAIVAALRQQPAPVDLEQFREAVECLCNGAGSMSSAEWARRNAERKRLLSIIDNAGGVECATCGGRGEVGGHTGQTPEQFDYVTEPCPKCAKQSEAVDEDAAARVWEAMQKAGYLLSGGPLADAHPDDQQHAQRIALAAIGQQPAPVVDDAMRELIAADVEYDTARSAAKHMCTRKDTTGVDFCNAIDRVEAARSRRIAALARAQGVQS